MLAQAKDPYGRNRTVDLQLLGFQVARFKSTKGSAFLTYLTELIGPTVLYNLFYLAKKCQEVK